MRVLFETIPNRHGETAKVYSRNPYGEYEVKLYVPCQYKAGHKRVAPEATAYESDLESACGTALAMYCAGGHGCTDGDTCEHINSNA